jgi:3-methyladenine DNA glycosylase/8-oxoguanine DNA glycosylase
VGRPVRVPLPRDFDFAWAVRFLAARTVPAIEAVTAERYSRTVWLEDAPGNPVTVTVERRLASASAAAHLRARATPALPAGTLRRTVARMFDLDVDLTAFTELAGRDPVLDVVLRGNPPGLRLPQLVDPFEALVRAILGQQVSVAAASTMVDRLTRLLGATAPNAFPPLAFPRPGAIADAGETALRTIGLTRAKAATVAGAARAVASGAVDFAALRRASAEECDRVLCALPGIGPWTAAYVRMRALGDRDAFPAADLGVVKALAAHGIPRSRIEATAERWRPWRGYATLHLWHSLARIETP